MKRWLAFLIVFLLGTQAGMVGSVSGDLSLLTDGGQTDRIDQPLVLWASLNDGRVLTVDSEGNVSVNTFNNGVLSTQWTVFLEVDANNARLDDAQELVTIAHDAGAYVVQMSTQTIYWNITTPDPVDDAALDKEGELWLVYYAGKRRADQYDTTGFTGNYPPEASIEGCVAPHNALPEQLDDWTEIVCRSTLTGDVENSFKVHQRNRFGKKCCTALAPLGTSLKIARLPTNRTTPT